MNYKNFKKLILFFKLICLLNCGIYTFMSTSLSNEVKTFSIKDIYNRHPQSEAVYVSDTLTKKMKNKLETILVLKEKNGDIQFSGELMDYKIQNYGDIPEVYIKFKIKYLNKFEKKIPSKDKNKKKSDNDIIVEKHKKLDKGETNAGNKILDDLLNEIINEIFDKTISKWE